MKSIEIKEKINEQRKLLRNYNGDNMEEARAFANKIEVLEMQLKEAEKEEAEERNFANNNVNVINKSKDEMRNLSNYIFKNLNGTLTKEDRALVTEEKVGALLPSTFINSVKEIQKNLVDLSKYAQVIPVNTKTGILPFSVDSQNIYLDELDRKTLDKAKDTNVEVMDTLSWVLKTYANFTAIDSEVTEDDIYNLLTSKVQRDFAIRSACTRTKVIFDILKANKTDFDGDNAYSILDILDKAIAKTDKMQKNGLVILMDLKTYAYIDSMRDSMGRRLDLIKDDKYLGKYPVEQISDSLFVQKTKEYGVMIANIYNSVVMFKKKGLTVELKKDALVTEYKDVIRVAERYDCQKADTSTIKYMEADN